MNRQKKVPLLKAEGLEKTFRQGSARVRAVAGIDLEIYPGEVFGLVGESGCGKSTLGNLLVRLLEPTSGTVFYRGEDVTRPSRQRRKELCRKMQIVFQDPYSSIDTGKTIGWLMEEPLKIHGLGTKEERLERVNRVLRAVGLDETFRDRWPSELSGGQRQRVAIALALVLEPEFLVCDEPVSALDVSVQAQVLNLLSELKEAYGLTYLFISHDLDVVSYLSDRIGVMYLGGLVELGPGTEISSHPMHPYSQALFSDSILLPGDQPSPAYPPPGCPFHTRCPLAEERCRGEKPLLREMGGGRFCACHKAGQL